MVEPRRIRRERLRDDPHAVWNEFVALLADSEYDELNEVQRDAYLVFCYESEVQNGGHLQFFENAGAGRVPELAGALRRLGADCQANLLGLAVDRWLEKARPRIRSVEEYVEIAGQAEFDSFDRTFHECRLTLTDVLEDYLRRHQTEFVVFVE
jgi:hypothetical protein